MGPLVMLAYILHSNQGTIWLWYYEFYFYNDDKQDDKDTGEFLCLFKKIWLIIWE